jgi:glycerate kinase
MKIVAAPNAFKGSLGARAAAAAMARGARRARPDAEVAEVPVSDGGDGLVDVLAAASGGERRTARVRDPLGRPVEADWALLPGETAAIEMALASGLALLRDGERDPLRATTAGTGDLVAAALDAGARTLRIGIGGSATNDGGAGLAAALGVRFLDASGEPFVPAGGTLRNICRIEMEGLREDARTATVEVLCDVRNPLLGPEGASRVYAPQKGASAGEVETLEAGLAHLADRIEADCGVTVRDTPGAGAAGGLGAGLMAFLSATLRPGVEAVLEMVRLREALAGAELVLTAEGALDSQSVHGKAPVGVAGAARGAGVPCIALAGSLPAERDALREAGLVALFPLVPGPRTLDQALARAEADLVLATEEVVRAFLAGVPESRRSSS